MISTDFVVTSLEFPEIDARPYAEITDSLAPS